MNFKYPPVGKCIYCGETQLLAEPERLSDEHIIPYAFGGNLMLPESSCSKCQQLINREIETPVNRREWGYFRSRKEFPTRNKKRRESYIKLRKKSGKKFKMPIEDYSAPVIIYMFNEARILSGLGLSKDNTKFTPLMLTDSQAETDAQRKYPEWDRAHELRPRPYEFARLIAKIGFSYACAEIGVETFEPLVRDLILGRSDDYFNFVGGTREVAPRAEGGDHFFRIEFRPRNGNSVLIVIYVHFLARFDMPIYHAVVGRIDFNDPAQLAAFNRLVADGRVNKLAKPAARWDQGLYPTSIDLNRAATQEKIP